MPALVAVVVALVAFSPSLSRGQGSVTVSQYAFVGPATPQSPYTALLISAFASGVQSGIFPSGNSLTPAYVSPIANGGTISINQIMYTPYQHSWNGSTAVSGAFVGERGNQLNFAVVITSPTPFTLNQVSYTFTDSTGYSDSGVMSGIDYSWGGEGILFGSNGNTVYKAGDGDTLLVNEAILVGNSWAMGVGQNQTISQIETVFDKVYKNHLDITAGFGLSGVNSSETINIVGAPEPQSVTIFIAAGLAFVSFLRWKKR